MGTYWKIENTEENRKKFKEIYDKHYQIDKNQFLDDFTHINTCEEVWCDGDVKVGVRAKLFHSKAFREDLKKNFKIEEG